MSAFMQIEGIDGEATDPNHGNWILIESMSSAIRRSISDVDSACGLDRADGNTSSFDIVVFRHLDKSSPQLFQACANGNHYADIYIHFCIRGLDYAYFSDGHETFSANLADFEITYLEYHLSEVTLTSCSFHGRADCLPRPAEAVTLRFSRAAWEYTDWDPRTNAKRGSFRGALDMGAAKNPLQPESRCCPRCGNCDLIPGDCAGPDFPGAIGMTEPGRFDLSSWPFPLPGRDFYGCGQCGLLWKDVDPVSLRGRNWIAGSLSFERSRGRGAGSLGGQDCSTTGRPDSFPFRPS